MHGPRAKSRAVPFEDGRFRGLVRVTVAGESAA